MQKPLAVFELGINHKGDSVRARRMVDTLISQGATYITIQVLTEPLDYSRNEDAAIKTRPNCLSIEAVLEIVRYAHAAGAQIGAAVLDPAHVKPLVEAGVRFFKVLSSDLTFAPLHRAIIKQGLPVYLSTGASDVEDIARAIQLIRDAEPKADIRLIHTVLKVPTPAQLLNLANIPELAERFKVPVAYGQHSDISDTLLVATALGVETVFVYVAEEHSPDLPDGPHAVLCSEVKSILDRLSLVRTMLGSRERVLSADERELQGTIRRSVVAAQLIKKGEKIEERDLAYKRPGTGRTVWDTETIIGTVATKDYQKNEDI